MKNKFTAITIFTLLLIAFTVTFLSFTQTAKDDAPAFKPVAVVELFTSQGCSSCPSADKLLGQTITDAQSQGKNIYPLSFHVDYWNRLGWADPFSSNKYSQRQRSYVSMLHLDGSYTPQMVVNGIYQFVGSDKNSLSKALNNALNTDAEINFKTLKATYDADKTIKVQFSLEGNSEGSTINFALISLNETTSVKRGENGGRTLTNENVVRQLITQNTSSSGEITFANSPVPSKDNAAIVAFVQQTNNLKIIGAAMAKIN